jgi:chromosomal replication initiation ATPase DnaA
MQPRAAPRQLALALSHAESFAREDFLPGPCNETALTLVERWPDWPARVVALVGPHGSGKSHLAAIWANIAGARFLAGRALALTHLPSALATGALVLEDLMPEQLEERALFHLINLAREHEAYVLLTAPSAPATWTIDLADLVSRLRAIPAVMLSPPDDALLRAVLVKLFADRQIMVDESLLTYLSARLERSIAAARAAVDALDREALRRKRPVTRALAADVLEVQWELSLPFGDSGTP